jgi:hypothetical protein
VSEGTHASPITHYCNAVAQQPSAEDEQSRRAWLHVPRWLWVPLLAFFLSRLGVAFVAYIATPIMADSAVPPYHIRPDNTLLDVFGSRWDTGFYLSITDAGYRYEGVDLPSVAFFPLLPLLMRAVKAITGDSLTAGILITNAALLGASVFLYRLTEDEWGTAVADRAVWYFLIFPTSFFGSAIYSESIFLFCAIGAYYLARRGYWESAALLGILATLSRLMGILVAPLLLLEWWRQWRSPRRPSLLTLLAPLVIPLGTLAYMIYLNTQFGDPFAFARASAAWGRVATTPLATIGALFESPLEGWWPAALAGRLPLDNWIDLAFVLFFLVMGGLLLWQRRWAEGVFVILGTIIPFSSGLLMSQRRYVWILFPVFILLARWGSRYPWFDRLITAAFLLALALFTALFANWYWVG